MIHTHIFHIHTVCICLIFIHLSHPITWIPKIAKSLKGRCLFQITSFSILNFHGVHSYLHACIHAVVFIILKTSNFRRVLTRWYRVPIQHPFWAQSPPKLEDALYTRMLYLAFETCFRTNMWTIDGCEYEIYSWGRKHQHDTQFLLL